MKKLFLRIAAVLLVAYTIMVVQQSLAQQKAKEKEVVVDCSIAEQVKGGKTKSCCMPSKASAVRATAKPAEKKQ